MKKIKFMFLASVLLLMNGCYDDSALWEKLREHEERISQLELLCSQQNTNIAALQTMVSALQENDYVTGVAPVMEDDEIIGYTITFSKSGSVTIYNGKDGYVPSIGIKQDTDGNWYWTLEGDWMTDAEGNKIRASAEDGTTPRLKIIDGYWYVSYDNGVTWEDEPLGQATADRGDSIFSNIEYDDEYIYLTLASDGTVLKISRNRGSESNPFTVAEALSLIASGNEPSYEVYVKGTITALKEYYGNANGSYGGSYSYYISDAMNQSYELLVYKGLYFKGQVFDYSDQINVGDEVVIRGVLINYNGTLPELSSGSRIIEINGSREKTYKFWLSSLSIVADCYRTSASFDINSNVEWTITSDNPDYSVETLSGSKNSRITVTFPANNTYEDRIVKLTVSTMQDVPVKSYEIVLTHLAQTPGVTYVCATREYLAENKDGNVGNTGVISYTNNSTYTIGTITELRVYSGNSLTISAASGYTIVEVILTCGAAENAKYGFYTTPNCLTVDDGATTSASVAETIATINISGTTSRVVYTAEAQLRVNEMVVKYKKI